MYCIDGHYKCIYAEHCHTSFYYFHLIRFKFEFEFYLFIYGNNMRVIYVLCNQSDISNGELVRQRETNLKREKCTRDSLTSWMKNFLWMSLKIELFAWKISKFGIYFQFFFAWTANWSDFLQFKWKSCLNPSLVLRCYRRKIQLDFSLSAIQWYNWVTSAS